MESAEGVTPGETLPKIENKPQWTEITPVPGKRTLDLINTDPRLGRLKSIKILEHLSPGSETGIVLFPGIFDHVTEHEALEMGEERNMSVFHIKYPADSSFSIRREVSQAIDYLESKGIKKCHLVAGSWGGIPAFNTLYNLLKEGNVSVESFFTVAAAFQPSDLAIMVREVGGRMAFPFLKLNSVALPNRQVMARISRGVPEFSYEDSDVLEKVSRVPTVILVPPGSKDWWVDARRSHSKLFPHAQIIEYPADTNFIGKITTFGGHDSRGALGGIRQIERALFDDPKSTLPIPNGFRAIR